MIFNSVTYLVFLAVVAVLYWRLPDRPRQMLILVTSVVFYGFWRFDFAALLLASVAGNWLLGGAIAGSADERTRKALLAVGVALNLAVLGVFKYTLFILDTVNGVAAAAGFETFPTAMRIVLPLGISFYTFQALSYVVDVYRRMVPAERDPLLFACYVAFFPQLVAGPILRSREVIPQLARRPDFDPADMVEGIRRILAGLFLKVVLADPTGRLVDAGFAQPPAALSAWDVWTLAFLFGFQIYFDFAAYSHIALGSARVMGIRFPENFDFPYAASSPRDFWRRWHISLSAWVRDYLYLPLAGARPRDDSQGGLDVERTPTRVRAFAALWISWLLMGLWHGANWTFVLWGAWHAALVSAHRLGRAAVALPVAVGRAVTLPLVMLGWIAFRAPSVGDTLVLWAKVVTLDAYVNATAPRLLGILPQPLLSLSRQSYVACVLLLAAVSAAAWLAPRLRARSGQCGAARLIAETAAWAVCVGLVFVYLRPVSQFIYFQF